MGWAFCLIVVLTAVALVASTANLSLRHFSRLQLQKILEDRRKIDLLDKLSALRSDMILATAVVRMVTSVGIILAVVELLWAGPDQSRTVHYVESLAASSALVLVFIVAIPNAWAKYAAEMFLARSFFGLRVCRWLLQPITAFLRLFDGLVRRLAGVPNGESDVDGVEGRETAEREILEAVSEGEMHGAVAEEEKEMIESVIELRDTHVGQIMTPRTEMVTIDVKAGLEEVKELIAREGHSRIPVHDGSLDNINGVLYAKDLLQLDSGQPFDARKVMRRVPFVPESKSLPDLLHEFQERKVHLAIVLDEYGGTAGLVTIEDILEELVGEITDEYEPPEPEPLVRVGPDQLEVDGRVRVDQINDELSVELPEDEDYDTVAGFVFSTLGRIPKGGEQFSYENLRFTVLDAGPRKINRLAIERVGQDHSL
ncbi:MAG TPA: hemolysin family protein [Phycisphaerae bacterium]|nr:hemolysin family protein [Phycisphaerae bacterium]